MNMRTLKKTLTSAILAAIPFSGFGTLALWNVDFTGQSGAAFTGAGVVGNAGDAWLNRTIANPGSPFSIGAVGDATNTITLEHGQFASTGGQGSIFPTAQEHLMKDYFWSQEATARNFQIAGLNSAHTYSLYMYAGTDAAQSDPTWYGARFTIGSETKQTQNPSASTRIGAGVSLTEGVHYVVFENISPTWNGSSWVIDGSIGRVSGATAGTITNTYVWNGMQIVAIPEPGTLVMVGLFGLAGLVGLRRRRK